MNKVLIDRSVVEQALEALNASMPHNNDMDEDWPSHIAARRALRAALEQQQVEQEPAIYPEEAFDMGLEAIPYYTHPQPPRQPLTDQQIHDCFQHRHRDKATERRMITRAIEVAHGIGGEA